MRNGHISAPSLMLCDRVSAAIEKRLRSGSTILIGAFGIFRLTSIFSSIYCSVNNQELKALRALTLACTVKGDNSLFFCGQQSHGYLPG